MKYYLQDIELPLHLGVPYSERVALQTVLVDIFFSADATKGSQTDNINDVVDYSTIYNTVKSFAGKEYDLVEAILRDILQELSSIKELSGIAITVHKSPFTDAKISVTATEKDL